MVDSGDYAELHPPEAHASSHESVGSDQMDITGLIPSDHAPRHESGGADEIDVSGLIGVGHKGIDRGDPSPVDFAVGDLTKDGNWHILNLAGICPEGTLSVRLRCTIQAYVEDVSLSIRKYGNTNDVNAAVAKIYVTSVDHDYDLESFCDSSRRVEYMASSTTWATLNITVRSWFI